MKKRIDIQRRRGKLGVGREGGCRELASSDGIAPDWCNTTEH